MKKIVLTIVAMTAAVPAFAQTGPNTMRSGVRVEARAGWDRPVFSLNASDGVDDVEGSAGKSGVTYGGELGFDTILGERTLVGAYVGLEDSSVKECAELYEGDRFCVGAGRNITVGVRIGAQYGTGMLAYVKGGYSNGAINANYRDPAFPEDNFDEQGDLDGFHLGAGGEFALARNFYGKLEYVYSNYGDFKYSDGDVAAGLGIDRHQVVAGFGIRF